MILPKVLRRVPRTPPVPDVPEACCLGCGGDVVAIETEVGDAVVILDRESEVRYVITQQVGLFSRSNGRPGVVPVRSYGAHECNETRHRETVEGFEAHE